jgi:tRNA nucleotidyltransferase (CCA-adding enzyme)
MEIYQVGGSVRDRLLGRDSEDRDWVVVGATQQDMLDRGFRQVGADFPVFLHPETGDEYALARVERKAGAGYGGFTVETAGVTLEEDLSRRDLTINAMALRADGTVVDPYGGQKDLAKRQLRHVSSAFSEDPLRVLRLLRFHSRFGPSWTVAEDTWNLAKQLVASGELSCLVPERIWKELSRALLERHPDIFLRGMKELGLHALPRFEPYRLLDEDSLSALKRASSEHSLEARYSVAFASTGVPQEHQCIPSAVQRVAAAWASVSQQPDVVAQAPSYPEEVHDLFVRLGAFKEGDLAERFVQAAALSGLNTTTLSAALGAARSVDTRSLTASMPPGPQVGKAIRAARLQAIAAV